MSSAQEGPRGMIAAMWVVLVLGCGVAVAVLWFGALLDVFTLSTTPSPSAAAAGHRSLDAAAVVSAASAVATVVMAVVLLRRGLHRVGAVVALVLALVAPWVPVAVAASASLAGD
ncbi:hypothetical protein ITJ54_02985 [Curtobacterium sp. VKM Ac-2865]|uniref:hypothetical protein n=1 Tax=Curtobacterium sp. VKM Ac-2865 TaxID=2783817 RepID=UPI00188B5EC2|nr:hypothetical protein [Curtobacterium sp. VKM Ac-2865]MBF4581627.1 hypothetical protein [Curtobacterium sp. VKM Ac-2865]